MATKKGVLKPSKITLSEVVKRALKRNVNFFELDGFAQNKVFSYLAENHLDLRIFESKWYDILSNKFYAFEYVPSPGSYTGYEKEKKDFDSFKDFFQYVQGDIYDRCCFYGYKFSKEEIAEFSIHLSQINFDSLINETIDDYTFKYINESEDEDIESDRPTALFKWLKDFGPVSTIPELHSEYSKFTKEFTRGGDRSVFFSFLLREYRDAIKEALIGSFCKYDLFSRLRFDSILLTYGRDVASYVIENYVSSFSAKKRKEKIKSFKDQLAGYDSGNLSLTRKVWYEKYDHFYHVEDTYSNGVNTPLKKDEYFTDFCELASFLHGNLSNANLSTAPVTKDEVLKYRINEYTELPLSKEYVLEKKYEEGNYVVLQRWKNIVGRLTQEKEYKFTKFFDFVHFLKGDLSNADLVSCDGIENIVKMPGLKLEGVKARSEVAEKLGLPLNLLDQKSLAIKDFELTGKYELESVDAFLMKHPEDETYLGKVAYITDIHLPHRFKANKCKTFEDVDYVIRSIAATLKEQSIEVNLIGGDTSSDIVVFERFVSNLSTYGWLNHFFFTLGNHELWSLNGGDLDFLVDEYRLILKDLGHGRMHLVQNNLFYLNYGWKEITDEDLARMSGEELRQRTRSASLLIFGGIGFSGKNEAFNADNGIYMNALNRKQEIEESRKFFALYEKVTSALKGKNLIVFTHMPLEDWGGKEAQPKEGVVYVSGHNHRNYFYDDGKRRIYADNQVGYKGKSLSFKKLLIDFGYDWFSDYKDGIYEITKEDYEMFYRGVGNSVSCNRQFESLHMIKRENIYMFLMKNTKGNMMVLNGGLIRGAGKHSLEYFYENLEKYATSVRLFLSKYGEIQKRISREVKRFGGSGRIHGCIVDIDYFNHLYLNPLDGTITPYYATSMTDKYVYDNLPSLLKYQCPKLFDNYQDALKGQSDKSDLIIYDKKQRITKRKIYVKDTEMYRVSRIFYGLQFTIKFNIVRLWNDSIVADASESNGKLIVLGIINPDSMPKPIEEPKPKVVQEIKPKVVKPVISEEEKIRIRDEKYKESIRQVTNGKVMVELYRGASAKADYKCNVCGHTWSTMPDHFKDRQGYCCPKCKGNNK